MDTNQTNGYHDPVRAHSLQRINEMIDARIEENIAAFRMASPQEINERLNELEVEWDVERMTLANLGGLAAAGGLLGMLFSRRWFWLSALAGGFIVQQTMKGWSPPVSIARRFRMRTREEIDREYVGLCNVLAEHDEESEETPDRQSMLPEQPGLHTPPPEPQPGMGAAPVMREIPPESHTYPTP